ncbi:hypothetical protein E2C01_071618 [Portunus trituberculatus]|uniref:Uncharacterized protein n=1 Tax=Portunus trituberculatus TaxID=210409 RepID=A0A5B7HVT6_PORTR|nr:hypothetical protein [Portunus trituberculatus]
MEGTEGEANLKKEEKELERRRSRKEGRNMQREQPTISQVHDESGLWGIGESLGRMRGEERTEEEERAGEEEWERWGGEFSRRV